MAITHYMTLASKRGAEDVTHTYCKTAAGFTTDDLVDDMVLTLSEAQTQYDATAADGSPYSIVTIIAVHDDENGTQIHSEKTS